MGRRGNAAEILTATRTRTGSLETSQRVVDALVDSVNLVEQKRLALEKRVTELEFWLTNNDWRQEQLRTDGAVQTTLAEYVMVDERMWLMEALVAARKDDGTDRAFYRLEGLFYREGIAAVQQGLTTSLVNLESDIAWVCDFDVNVASVRIRVTGTAATNIDWRSWTRFREHVER